MKERRETSFRLRTDKSNYCTILKSKKKSASPMRLLLPAFGIVMGGLVSVRRDGAIIAYEFSLPLSRFEDSSLSSHFSLLQKTFQIR